MTDSHRCSLRLHHVNNVAVCILSGAWRVRFSLVTSLAHSWALFQRPVKVRLDAFVSRAYGRLSLLFLPDVRSLCHVKSTFARGRSFLGRCFKRVVGARTWSIRLSDSPLLTERRPASRRRFDSCILSRAWYARTLILYSFKLCLALALSKSCFAGLACADHQLRIAALLNVLSRSRQLPRILRYITVTLLFSINQWFGCPRENFLNLRVIIARTGRVLYFLNFHGLAKDSTLAVSLENTLMLASSCKYLSLLFLRQLKESRFYFTVFATEVRSCDILIQNKSGASEHHFFHKTKLTKRFGAGPVRFALTTGTVFLSIEL